MSLYLVRDDQYRESGSGCAGRPVLVTGAHGRLGTVVVRALADRQVVAASRQVLDLTDGQAVRRYVAELQPGVIINCAAFNDVDGAEDQAGAALALNAFGVRSLARAAELCNATLVHYSTDFVFDGEGHEPYDETAKPSPRSVYAASKLLGEWFALDSPTAYVLRVESLFGCTADWSGPRGTLDTLVSGLREGRELRVFTDRIVTPSYLGDVAAATRHLVDQGAEPGLYHCVNSGQATWQDVATEAARVLGVAPRLQPVRTDQVQMRAQRPRFCAMSNRKLAEAGFTMPTWQDAMSRWLSSPPASQPARAH